MARNRSGPISEHYHSDDPRQTDLEVYIAEKAGSPPAGETAGRPAVLEGLIHPIDCIEGIGRLPRGSVDFVFADLPYGKTRNTWDKLVPIESLWKALRIACKPGAAKVFTASQPFSSLLVASNFEEFRHEMIWKKNKSSSFLNAKKMPLLAHENLLVFYREYPFYEVQKTGGHPPMHAATKKPTTSTCYGEHGPMPNEAGTTLRYPTSVLEIPVVNNDDPERIHSNQKPVDLVEWFLRSYTRPGDLVLDPTAGSGTTLVAAKRLGRRYVGFESDVAMTMLANERLCRTSAPAA